VIEEALDGRLELVLAEPVLDELERVLTVKLGFEPERMREIKEFLIGLASLRIEAPADPPESIAGDCDDDVILACAVAAGVEILVSGDRRHVLPLGEHQGVRIITAQALLAELAGA
jgi:predicted nucleic acid-binding protein